MKLTGLSILMAIGTYLVIATSAAIADAPSVDHLNGLGSHFFCNAANKLAHKPETGTSCTAIIQTNDLPSNIEAIKRGEFGVVQKEWTLKGVRHAVEFRDGKLVETGLPPNANLHFVISTVTLELLEVLRYDSRIYAMAPDTPLSEPTCPGGNWQ